MSGIYFVGSNPYYETVNTASVVNADLIVCASSERELQTALLVEKNGTLGLTVSSALSCINRLMFRMSIVGLDLSPKFYPVRIDRNGVLKMSTSVQNSGIFYLQDDDYTGIQEEMREHFPELNDIGVWESRVFGDHYEVSGFILDGVIRWRMPLKQIWNHKKDLILEYKKADINIYPLDKLTVALKRLNLDNTLFNCELIYSEEYGKWRLVEVQPRLGEDSSLDRTELERILKEFVEAFYAE